MDSANLEYNVLSTCERPISVMNKYTHELVSVPCGKCKACRMRKGNVYAAQIAYEEACHKFVYFVTLTYSDPVIPLMRFEQTDKELVYRFFDVYTDEYLFQHEFQNKEELDYILSNSNIKHTLQYPVLSYLNYKDLQNFLKRFRKNASSISDVPIRYFAVGEYGPTHYRCHWHIILYLDCERQASHIEELLHKSWQFGFLDYSLSRGKCNTYLAGYVNSTASLPHLYEARTIRQKCFHSFHLGADYFRRHKSEIYTHGLDYFATKVINVSGRNTYLALFPRIKCLLFPKCPAYGLSSHDSRLFAYTCERKFIELFGDRTKPHEFLASLVLYGGYQGYVNTCPQQITFVEQLLQFCDNDRKEWDFEYLKQFFYRILSVSRHFVNFCCDGLVSKAEEVLSVIEKFYNDVEYRNLKNWYSAIEEYGENYGTCYDVFYTCDNALDLFNDEDGYGVHNPVYNRLKVQLYNKFEKRVKTKKVNDQFNIFNH